MKYSILIVGLECHYSHLSRFIYNLKQTNPEANIYLCTDKNKEELSEEINRSVTDIMYFELDNKQGYLGVPKKILSLRKQFKKLSRKNKYDIINIHFPKYYLAAVMGCLRKMSSNILVSPWGSDVLRVEGARLKALIYGVFYKCDYITASDIGNTGRRILSYLPNMKNKFYPQTWGSETIDYINNHIDETDAQTAKKRFGLTEKYVITCGYNAFRAQNHNKIIEAIARIKHQLPDNLVLLFPVSYGAADKDTYVNELRKQCEEKQLDAIFVENYLSVQDVFYLRMSTDLFVHVQDTDSGNSSMQEYVLCGKKVIHGSWIHYKSFETYPPFYFPVSDFAVLGNVIIEAYNSDNVKVAPEVLDWIRHRGWREKMIKWNDMFVEIASKNKNSINREH